MAAGRTVVDGAFYVCPTQCEAMMLPRDMETIHDCKCPEDVNPKTLQMPFTCPTGAAATRVKPLSFNDCTCLDGFTRDEEHDTCTPDVFECTGLYTLRKGKSEADSIADCDCQHPYKKDAATGRCQLHTCPRAGNYVKKAGRGRVKSLADCTCVEPFVKDDASGECVMNVVYTCPPNAQPAPNRDPQTFADCHCDWGFVRDTKRQQCERESVAFVCPNHSKKRSDLALGERPTSFADCECDDDVDGRYVRNDKTHKCERIKRPGEKEEEWEEEERDDRSYRCPPYSQPLAAFPHSVEQCECLPGYGWKTPEMICVRLSAYTCPPHSYVFDSQVHVEQSFDDCQCARGFYRDEPNGLCLEWYLANQNGCPDFAFLKHWPLQSNANCECVYGRWKAPTPAPSRLEGEDESEEEEEEEDDTVDKATWHRKMIKRLKQEQRQQRPPLYDPSVPRACNVPPVLANGLTFSQCPRHSFATNWPVATPKDCTCMDGFEIAPVSLEEQGEGEGEGDFRCVKKKLPKPIEREDSEEEEDRILDEEESPSPKPTLRNQAWNVRCKLPEVRNPFNGACRLPIEEVQAVRDSRGEVDGTKVGPVLFNGIEYDYVLTEDDIMIIQGDIAIGELLRWGPLHNTTEGETMSHVLHGYYNADRDHRWKQARICYQFDASARSYERLIEEAMEHITDVTNFQFKHCINNACLVEDDEECASDFVSIQSTASSCFSYVGRIGGQQTLGVSSDCGVGNLMHVLLHTIGLNHIMDRPDRDDHVKIAWECLPESKRSYFIVEQEPKESDPSLSLTESLQSLTMETAYDYFSIMHHPANAFVHATKTKTRRTRGKPEVVEETLHGDGVRPEWCQSLIPHIQDPEERVRVLSIMGQRELLAVTDIHAVWRLYPSLIVQETPGYISGDQPLKTSSDVHESRLHVASDTITDENDSEMETIMLRGSSSNNKSFGQKLGSFIGAVVTLVGFAGFMAFAFVEFKKRSIQGQAYYSESLLQDKSLYD